MITYRIRVLGRVQGVFFRVSTKEKADELGVKGWVRNESDGSVLIEAQGQESTLNDFINWCKSGPRMANVAEVVFEKIESRNLRKFEITY